LPVLFVLLALAAPLLAVLLSALPWACRLGRTAGREPMFRSAISRMGVAAKKYSAKPGVS